VLLDRAPDGLFNKIENILKKQTAITLFHDVRIRTAGADTFVEINIHVNPNLSIQDAHAISDRIESEICRIVTRCEVHVHVEPENDQPPTP
jgi:divalent metal cation (Fe/Co/Zn/Cd) transporter